jgi:hypothetical protein
VKRGSVCYWSPGVIDGDGADGHSCCFPLKLVKIERHPTAAGPHTRFDSSPLPLITRAFVADIPADLPIITLTDQHPRIVAVDVFILAVGVMKSTTPFSARTYIVTDRNYLLALTDIVVGLVSPEVVFCAVFCDGLRRRAERKNACRSSFRFDNRRGSPPAPCS